MLLISDPKLKSEFSDYCAPVLLIHKTMNHHLAKIADKNKNPKTFLGIDCSSVQCGLILESALARILNSAENHHFVTKKIGESVQNFSSESAMLKILGNNLIRTELSLHRLREHG